MAEHALTTPARRTATPAGPGGRRSLFASAAALALAGAGGSFAAAAPAHPDATLLRLGDRFDAARRVEAAAWAALDDSAEFDDDGPLTKSARNLADATGLIVDEIEASTATTEAGLVVKLRAYLWCRGAPDASDRDGCTDERVMAGIWDDAAAMDAAMLDRVPA